MPTENKLTGYPSIDKPWLKYYSEETINEKQIKDELLNDISKAIKLSESLIANAMMIQEDKNAEAGDKFISRIILDTGDRSVDSKIDKLIEEVKILKENKDLGS